MKKFNFRLQRVADVRETRKKECQRELASSQMELTKCEQQLTREQRESSQSRDLLRQALDNGSAAKELNALDDWRRWKDQKAKAQSFRTDKQRGVVEQKRKDLIQASKEKKILERLKERRLTEHRTRTLKEEQAFLDELAGRTKKSQKNGHKKFEPERSD